MKSNIHLFKAQDFKKISFITFIVYFITVLCGYLNFFFANFYKRIYFPLRSYLITFDKSQVSNLPNLPLIYDLAGYKALIKTSIPYKIIDDVFFILICTLLTILFFIGYKIVQSNKIHQTEIIKWSIIFALLMAFSIPANSSDLYGYVARGAEQSLYKQNPYLETISKIKNYNSNPLFLNFMWPETPTTYGPLFIYITKAIVSLNNNSFFLSLINFKLLNLTAFFLMILLLLKTNKTKDIYLIAWNPLIMIQGLWNCHNDLLSGVLIFVGIWLLTKESYFWSMFSLTLAAGVKFVALLIIPIIFYYFFKTKLEKFVSLNLLLGLLCGIILISIFSIDYLLPLNQVTINTLGKLYSNVSLVHKSLIDLLFTFIKYFCKWQDINCDLWTVQTILKCFFYFIFASFYIYVLFRKKSNLIFDIVLVLFIFFAFTTSKFHSWYLLNLILFIPMLENGLLKKILIALSMSHIFAITFIDQAKILNFLSMTLLPSLSVFFREKKKK